MQYKWTIGEMAKLFDVSTDALRYYEKAGLLSSDRHQENGYRYYSYDDLFVLMDILLFRNLGVAVKDIQPMVTTMDLGDMKQVLLRNDRLVEEKIQALVNQRAMLAKIITQYERCEQQLGKFSIVPAPAFRSKFLGEQVEDMIELIRQYKPDQSWMQSVRYTLLLPPDKFLTKRSFDSAQIGISFDEQTLSKFDCSEQEQFSALPAKDCLYTVLGTDYSGQENAILAKALAWVKAQGRQVTGPLLGSYLASCHKDGLDYYEIWIVLHAT
jgi:DNA-binding transcriptional MerR regulator